MASIAFMGAPSLPKGRARRKNTPRNTIDSRFDDSSSASARSAIEIGYFKDPADAFRRLQPRRHPAVHWSA
jgi:hypothetical protein